MLKLCVLWFPIIFVKNVRLNATLGLLDYYNGEADTDTVHSYYLQVNLPIDVLDRWSGELKNILNLFLNRKREEVPYIFLLTSPHLHDKSTVYICKLQNQNSRKDHSPIYLFPPT